MHRVESHNLNHTHHSPLRAEKEGCLNRFKQTVNNVVLKHLCVFDFSKSLKRHVSFFLPAPFKSIDRSQKVLKSILSLEVQLFNHMLLNLRNPETILYTRLCFAKKIEERGRCINKNDFIRDSGFWERYFFNILEKGFLKAKEPIDQAQIEKLFFDLENSLKNFPTNQEFKSAMACAFDKIICKKTSSINLNKLLPKAVREGHALVAQALLKAGADTEARVPYVNPIESMDGWGMTLLHIGAQVGQVEVIRVLLKAGANKDAETSRKETPLHYAALAGNVEVVEALLEAHANKEKRNEWMRTPLHSAAAVGNLGAVEALVSAGANIEALGASRQTALYMAAMNGRPRVVQFLLHVGANKEEAAGAGINTPLQIAVFEGHPLTVRVLLEAEVNKEVRDHDRKTPLHLAAERGNAQIVHLLLKAKVNTEARDDRGRTPLDLAQTQEIRELLEYKTGLQDSFCILQ